MRTLVVAALLCLVGIAVAGFYRGWFEVSADTSSPRPNATITVDKEKIHADEQKAKAKVQDFGKEAKAKPGDQAGNVKEPESRP